MQPIQHTTSPRIHRNDIPDHPSTSHMKELSAALESMQANPRVARITVAVSHDACPAGRAIQATYPKECTPDIPLESCSRPEGCNCRYIPVLDEIFP